MALYGFASCHRKPESKIGNSDSIRWTWTKEGELYFPTIHSIVKSPRPKSHKTASEQFIYRMTAGAVESVLAHCDAKQKFTDVCGFHSCIVVIGKSQIFAVATLIFFMKGIVYLRRCWCKGLLNYEWSVQSPRNTRKATNDHDDQSQITLHDSNSEKAITQHYNKRISAASEICFLFYSRTQRPVKRSWIYQCYLCS
jgi:hypothetical protein